jgi:hypothetical protein
VIVTDLDDWVTVGDLNGRLFAVDLTGTDCGMDSTGWKEY